MKKITLILAALAIVFAGYAQKPEINRIRISGRGVEGIDFTVSKAQEFTKVSNGVFVWYGKLLYDQQGQGSGSKGFKFAINDLTGFADAGNWSLVAPGSDNIAVSDGNAYTTNYVSATTTSNDYKWRLASGGDGYYKITVYTSDVNNVTFRLDKLTNGTFADLAGLSVAGGNLVPAFDPSQTTYTCTFTNTTLSAKPTVTAYCNNPATGANVVDISSGSGTSTIVVTSLDKVTPKTYTITYSTPTVTPQQAADATLSSIMLSAGTIANFSPATKTYNVTLPVGITSVKPEVVTTFIGATVTGNSMISLDPATGVGTSSIEVTAYDGVTKETYTIHYNHGANDYSYKIINSDFDWTTQTVPFSLEGTNYPLLPDNVTSSFSSGIWRTIKNGFNRGTGAIAHLDFYGWQLSDWNCLFNDINGTAITVAANAPQIRGAATTTNANGPSSAFIVSLGKCIIPENFRLYQTINGLDAGVYKVTCLLGAEGSRHTSERLFAQTPTQHKVQFYGKESEYTVAFTTNIDNEIRTYAGHTADQAIILKPMEVYVAVQNGESLDLGVRSGNMRANGTTGDNANPSMFGCFSADNFTLSKVDASDASDATLSSITLSVGTVDNFLPATGTYEVTLPQGTTSVIPTAVVNFAGATLTGAGAVDVSGGTGISTIVVTAADGATTKTYTINYTISGTSGLSDMKAQTATWSVDNGKLTVQGVDTYQVYSINGVKVVNAKASDSINLIPGVYIVKTNNAETFKVVVK